MKTKAIKTVLRSGMLVVVLMLIFCDEFMSQNEPVYVMEISNGEKSKFLDDHKKAKIRYEGENYKGVIHILSTDTIEINNNKFGVEKIEDVSFILNGTETAGKIVTLSSIPLLLIGIVFITKAGNDENPFMMLYFSSFGVIFSGLGVVAMTIGIITQNFNATQFKRNEGWTYKIVEKQ